MSFVFANPDVLATAATDLAQVGGAINAAHADAAAQTTSMVAAAEDEVSTAIAALFMAYARDYRTLSTQAAEFHDSFVQVLKASAGSYLAAEAANAAALLNGAGAAVDVNVGTGASGSLAELVGTTLVMGGSGMPLPSTGFINAVNNLFIQRNLLGTIPQALATPEQFYPFGTINQLRLVTSVSQGVQLLDAALQPYIATGTPVGVFGYSQSAVIASLEMAKLQAQGVASSAVHFVLIGNLMNPNGGIFARFPGLQLTALGIDFYGATPDDAYSTTIYTMEYDAWADFPRYPLNVLSLLNTVASQTHFLYPDLTSQQLASAVQLTTSGNTLSTYYMISVTNLPLLNSVRDIPLIGNPVADLLQPNLRYLVNMGYGDPRYGWSTAPANVPTSFGIMPSRSAYEMLPALLASGTQQGIHDFIGDLNGTGPHPVTWPWLSSLQDPSSATGNTLSPLARLSAVRINPVQMAQAITNAANTIASSAPNVYSVLLPTTDVLSAALISVPSYDVSLFLDGISQVINGEPVAGLVNAIAFPLVANIALYLWLANFESAIIANAIA